MVYLLGLVWYGKFSLVDVVWLVWLGKFGLVRFRLVGNVNLAITGYYCNFQTDSRPTRYFFGRVDGRRDIDNRATSV